MGVVRYCRLTSPGSVVGVAPYLLHDNHGFPPMRVFGERLVGRGRGEDSRIDAFPKFSLLIDPVDQDSLESGLPSRRPI